MNPTFTIIWVEDKPRTVGSQVDAIRKYLKSRNFEPNIILDEDGTQFQKAIADKISIDIVVTDKNLTESMDGIGIVKKLKQKKRLTDVLFYSAKAGFDPEEVRQAHYGFVEIVEGKEIEDQLKKLIDKNLKRCEDIIFLRGMVISQVIDLELKVNEFFAHYFKIQKNALQQFHNFILENKYNTLAGKKSTIAKILKENKIEKEFQGLSSDMSKLAEERNLLAHCKTDPARSSVLICMGEKEEFDKNRINDILQRTNKTSEQLEKLHNRNYTFRKGSTR